MDYPEDLQDRTQKFAEDQESHNDFIRLMDTFATVIGTTGVGLIGYAFVREAYDEDTTPALRITLLILGAIMLLQLLGSGFNLTVSL